MKGLRAKLYVSVPWHRDQLKVSVSSKAAGGKQTDIFSRNGMGKFCPWILLLCNITLKYSMHSGNHFCDQALQCKFFAVFSFHPPASPASTSINVFLRFSTTNSKIPLRICSDLLHPSLRVHAVGKQITTKATAMVIVTNNRTSFSGWKRVRAALPLSGTQHGLRLHGIPVEIKRLLAYILKVLTEKRDINHADRSNWSVAAMEQL